MSYDMLIAQHNLSEEKLHHVLKMQGIALPSLAITKLSIPVSSYGEITLLAQKDLVNPKKNKKIRVFGADVYSPRYPSTERIYNRRLAKLLIEELNEYSSITGSFTYDLDELRHDVNFIYAFLAAANLAPDLTGLTTTQKTNVIRDMVYLSDILARMNKNIEERLDAISSGERIYAGRTPNGTRKYIPHTLENVAKIIKKDLRGGENFDYGTGSVRAMHTPEFRTMGEIEKNANRLVSKEDFMKARTTIEDATFALCSALEPYYLYEIKAFFFTKIVTDMISDVPKYGLLSSLKNYDFSNVSDEVIEQIESLIKSMEIMPTEYFEAKIMEVVQLSFFSAAVVPDDTSETAIAALIKAGMEIITYVAKDKPSRQKAIAEAISNNSNLIIGIVENEKNSQELSIEEIFRGDNDRTDSVYYTSRMKL